MGFDDRGADAVQNRLAGISALNAINFDPNPALDRIVRLASALTGSPHAAIHIHDEVSQHRIAGYQWDLGSEPRGNSLCRLVVDTGSALIVPDATLDERFSHTSYVTGDAPMRFYLSTPLITESYGVLGALCVYDLAPREDAGQHLERLNDLAAIVVDTLQAGRMITDLAKAALTDPLTGLPNRRRIYETLTRLLRRRDRDGSPVSVAFVDLDGFKAVNDTHGHEVGDQVLDEVGARLQRVARADEMVGRIGGDEFVIVGGRGIQSDQAVNRFVEALKPPITAATGPIHSRASIGVAVARDGDTADTVLTRADQEMFRHKVEGN